MDDPTTLTPARTREQARQALAEGWCLFDCGGFWQVRRIDSPEDRPKPLQDDGIAWELVRSGAQPHHLAMQAFLQAHAPEEWDCIVDFRRLVLKGPAA